ncbi:S8 family peptidase [Actinokineospora sp. NPDC004072]
MGHQMIVDLPALDRVLDALQAAGVEPGATVDHERLGLTLVDLPGLRTSADALLADLRAAFGADAPEMDTNDDTVFGLPQHKGIHPPEPLGHVPAPVEGVDEAAGAHVLIGMVDTPLVPHEAIDPAAVTANELVDHVDGPWAGHATFVAGTILRYAPAASISLKAGLDGTTGTKTVWDVAVKLAALADEHPAIVNLSLGAATEQPVAPLALRRALTTLDEDVLVVAAAGNRPNLPDGARIWPAAVPDVLAVGAIGGSFTMRRPWVDLLAPGVDVEGPFPGGTTAIGRKQVVFEPPYARWSGTSFAAAAVSGLVAGLMSANPGMTARAAAAALPDACPLVRRYAHAG